MKKNLLLVVIGIFLFSGCAINLEKEISIQVKEKEYTVNDANKFVQVDIEINNNLGDKIYYEDITCGKPLKVYELSAANEWKVRTDLAQGCFGLAPGKDIPKVLQSGKILNTQKNIKKEGVYKIEFVYYLNEENYRNRASSQSIYSNQFNIYRVNATKSSVIEGCAPKIEQNNSRLVECLYVAAKNSAERDLNLALDLCNEIKNIEHGFDGCYDGVALILRRAGLTDKINSVCNNYDDASRVKKCLDMAQ